MKINVQVIDPIEVIKELEKMEMNAEISDVEGEEDEVIVDISDEQVRIKLKEWMLKSGWDDEDIKEIYPELL